MSQFRTLGADFTGIYLYLFQKSGISCWLVYAVFTMPVERNVKIMLFYHLTWFILNFIRISGKAAIGLSDNAEEGADDQSKTQGTDEGRPQASKKKKQKSSQSVPFSLVDIKLGSK
jgi:hypothetical protein